MTKTKVADNKVISRQGQQTAVQMADWLEAKSSENNDDDLLKLPARGPHSSELLRVR